MSSQGSELCFLGCFAQRYCNFAVVAAIGSVSSQCQKTEAPRPACFLDAYDNVYAILALLARKGEARQQALHPFEIATSSARRRLVPADPACGSAWQFLMQYFLDFTLWPQVLPQSLFVSVKKALHEHSSFECSCRENLLPILVG